MAALEGLRTPDLYPLRLDFAGRRGLLLRLSEEAYRSASFLDERLLETAGPGEWIGLDRLEAVATGLPERIDYIFHIGHVGSTLLARLLGRSDRVFALREPAVLRVLADSACAVGLEDAVADAAGLEARLGLSLRLFSRVWREEQRSLIKATSFVGAMASRLLARPGSPRALLLTVSPIVYIASILAGPNARAALPGLAAARLGRLHRRLGAARWRLEDMGEGELAAMSWVCETFGLTDAADRFASRVLWMDFEQFLDAPEAGLIAALRHLHGHADPREVADMVGAPDLRLYAKAPEHPFDAALRRRILAQAASDHRAAIDRGLAWLKRSMAEETLIDDAVRQAAQARQA